MLSEPGCARRPSMSRASGWECRICSSTWCSRERGTASARDIALSLEMLGGSLDAYTAREHTSYQARVLDEHLDRGRRCHRRPDLPAVAAPARICCSSGRWCSRRSAWWTTRRTISCSSCTTRSCGATHPYGHSILGTRDTRVGARGEGAEGAARARVPPVADRRGVLGERGARAARWRRSSGPGGARCARGDEAPLVVRSAAPAAPPRTSRGARERRRRTSCSARRPWRTTTRGATPWRWWTRSSAAGMSSRLFQRMREELGLAYSVHTFQSFHPDTGVAWRVRRHVAGDGGAGVGRDRRGARQAGSALAHGGGAPRRERAS